MSFLFSVRWRSVHGLWRGETGVCPERRWTNLLRHTESNWSADVELRAGEGRGGGVSCQRQAFIEHTDHYNWLRPSCVVVFLRVALSSMMGFLPLASLSWRRAELLRLVGETRLMWCESSPPWWDCDDSSSTHWHTDNRNLRSVPYKALFSHEKKK